jgi:hypothetical protein
MVGEETESQQRGKIFRAGEEQDEVKKYIDYPHGYQITDWPISQSVSHQLNLISQLTD